MKKVALFLLAVVLVAGFAGCGGGGGDDDDSITYTLIGDPKCMDDVATGTVTNTNTGWVSATITVSPGGTTVVTLPEKGTYHFHFTDKSGSWDFTIDVEDGKAGTLTCNGKMILKN